MSKGKIAIIVIGLLLVAVIGVGVWQKDNIQFLWKYWTMDSDKMQDEKDKLESDRQAAIDDLSRYGAVRDRQNTQGDATEPDSPVSTAPAASSGDSETGAHGSGGQPAETGKNSPVKDSGKALSEEEEALVNDCIEEFYELKDDYLGRIQGVFQEAIDEFQALPKKDQTKSNLLKIAPKYISEGLKLEKECDTKVNSLLSQLEKDLKAVDGDTSAVESLRTVYKSEKDEMRAGYLNLLN